MLDIHSLVGQLKRPRLLVQAARFGIDDYRRETDLCRMLKIEYLPRPADALLRLLDIESEINELRTKQNTHYPVAEHIEILTAIMSEARLLKAIEPEAV